MPKIVANVFAIAVILIVLHVLLRAPEGFENSDGFHFR